MKTQTSWSQLSAEIDQYKKKGKANLQKYQKKRFNILYRKKQQKTQVSLSSIQMPKRLGYSINLIREWKQQEAQQTSRIINKISFLKVQRDRKIQTTQRVKNKLSRILSIRSARSEQKQFCQNQIHQFKIKTYQNKRLVNEQIKCQKGKIDLQIKKMVCQNSFRARQLRAESIQNQECIKKQKLKDKIFKQKSVEKGKKQFQKSIQKKQQRQNKIIEVAKNNHQNFIRREYIKFDKNKKLNSQIYHKFLSQSKRIIEQTKQAHKNLLNFQRILMLRRKEQINFQKHIYSTTPLTNIVTQQNTVQKSKNKLNNFFQLTS